VASLPAAVTEATRAVLNTVKRQVAEYRVPSP
jgi:hypothetical protein